MDNIINFVAKNIKENQRIDFYLSKKFENLSRTKIKELILNKLLKVNDEIVSDPSKKVKIGDRIYLKVIENKEITLKPFDYRLDIKFEDEDLIIINKQAGISMHPGAGNYDKTLVNALVKYNKKNLSDVGEKFRPGIVHRIDKDTSGLIVIAKNNLAHIKLSNQFRDHSVERVYIALVWGKLRPQTGKIENFITRSKKNRQLMEVSMTKGKKAITNYKTIKVFEKERIPTFSLVECRLETGRTHQIRVHLSNKGNFILGDKHYKKRFKKLKNTNYDILNLIKNLDRQFLHAKNIGFIHPRNNKKLYFESKLPIELREILKKLENS